MANIATVIIRNALAKAPANVRWSSSHAASKIGNREVVGYGWNGQSIYYDRVDYPMPAIRFQEDTKEIKVSTYFVKASV